MAMAPSAPSEQMESTGWFSQVVSSIEVVLRYLVSGVLTCGAFTLASANPQLPLDWFATHSDLAAVIAVGCGFTVYTIYRAAFYVVGDWIAWRSAISAPSIVRPGARHYAEPFAEFIKWRLSPSVTGRLGSYLHYRWAVVHFLYILGLVLLVAAWFCHKGSVISGGMTYAIGLMLVSFGMATLQAIHLFRLEHALFGTDLKSLSP